MTIIDWLTVVAVVACLLISAFYSASETALTASSRAAMMRLEKHGNRDASIVNRLLAKRERLLGAVLFSNNLTNIAASTLATGLLLAAFGHAGVIYATIVMTVIIFVVCEILPKTAAFNMPDRMALWVARPVERTVRWFSPILSAVEWLVRVILHGIGMPVGKIQSILSPREELRGAVDLLHRAGVVEKLDRDMMGGVLDLRELTVSDVMVHRTKIVMLNADDPPREIVDAVLAAAVSRLPLWRDSPDNIVGVLHAKDLLRALHAVGGDAGKIDPAALATPPWFVPDTTPLYEQLQAFRHRKAPFALVVDEYGELEGLVTIKDIVEEIVGDITTEHEIAVPGVRVLPGRLRQCRRRGPDTRSQPRHGLEHPRRRGDDDRRRGDPRGTIHSGAGPELHLSRLPLSGAAPDPQPHHRAAHHAARAQGGGAGKLAGGGHRDRRGKTQPPFLPDSQSGARTMVTQTKTAAAEQAASAPIDPGVRIGHVHLKVADLDRALAFYCGVLGFQLMQRMGAQAAFISAGGYHHHIGLNTWESRGGSPPPPGTTGLYHLAVLYPTRAALADALRRLIEADIPLDGASDHGVSEALYLRDPDENGVELYWDRPREEWPRTADGNLSMFTHRLDLMGLLAEKRPQGRAG